MELIFTDDNFETEVLQADIPVLVDFYADWCVPCKMMAPVVESLAEQYEGKVKVGKINVDQNPDISEKYRVMSIPTCIVFHGGSVVETAMGVVSKNELTNILERVLA